MNSIRAILWTATLLLSLQATACFYAEHAFDPDDKSQTSVRDVFSGELPNPADTSGEEYRKMLSAKQAEASADPSNLDLQDDLAYLTFMTSQYAAAEQIYKSVLSTNPDRYSTLCSYATMLHLNNRHAEAEPLLARAIALKPGFRNGAEEMHLEMVRFQQRSLSDRNYAQSSLFLPQLTPIWLGRKQPPDTFETVDFPDIEEEGLAELLHQFPRFGEGWLAMAMLQEHNGVHDRAVRAYDRAVQEGTGKTTEIRQYMGRYRIYAEQNDPSRTSGSRLLRNVYIVAGIGVLLVLWIYGSRAYENIQEAKRNRKELLNKEKQRDGKPPR